MGAHLCFSRVIATCSRSAGRCRNFLSRGYEHSRCRERARRAASCLSNSNQRLESCPFWHGQFLGRRRCSGRSAFECDHHATAVCRAGSSADRSKTGTDRGARRRSVYRIFVAGSDPETAPRRWPFDPDKERPRHHRDSRQSYRHQTLWPRVYASAAEMSGGNRLKRS